MEPGSFILGLLSGFSLFGLMALIASFDQAIRERDELRKQIEARKKNDDESGSAA